MPNLNRVMLMGHLTRDVELRTAGSSSVGSFGIAVSRKWKDKDGADKEETAFVDCEAWGKTAEVLAQYTAKGHPLYVEGRLKLDQWEDKDGGKRSKIKVVVESFQFLKSRDAESKPEPRQETRRSAPPRPKAGANMPMDDDSVPF